MDSQENICYKLSNYALYCILVRARLENEFNNKFIEGIDTSSVINKLSMIEKQLAYTYNQFKELK